MRWSLRPRLTHTLALLMPLAAGAPVPWPFDIALAQTSSARPVGHGIELTAEIVGPRGAGLSPLAEHPGGDIRDGIAYRFARRVDTAAIYDGFRLGGPHLLIEQVTFTGPVDVYTALPVVLRGVEIGTRTEAPWALHTRPGAGPVLVLWSKAGAASTRGAPDDRAHALARGLYLRSDNVTVYRSHLTATADGIQVHAPGTRIIETLVDGLVQWRGDHNDGVQMLGKGADVEILRSRIVNPNPQTSALNLIGDRVRVTSSYLSGGGWTIYAGSHLPPRRPGMTREVVFRDNILGREHFSKGGNFGAVTGWDAAGPGNLWSGNRFADGAAIEVAPSR